MAPRVELAIHIEKRFCFEGRTLIFFGAESPHFNPRSLHFDPRSRYFMPRVADFGGYGGVGRWWKGQENADLCRSVGVFGCGLHRSIVMGRGNFNIIIISNLSGWYL